MIEILILYIICRREKTLYSIRKEIFEIFGAYTKPSIGTIHPALKRLLNQNAVTVNERFSDGGKKSSYYLITKKGLSVFREYFFDNENENPSLFYVHLQVRIGLMSMLSLEDRKIFIEESRRKLDLYKYEIENKLNDEFLELDYYQRQVMQKTLSELKSTDSLLKQLKVENDS